MRDADDLLFRILRRFAVCVDATTRRGMDCVMRDYWQLGRPLALSAQSASRSLSFVETRWDILSQRHAMSCQRHILRASFFLAVAEL